MRRHSEMVREFHDAFGVLNRDSTDVCVPEARLRADLIHEELWELEEALAKGDAVAAADALGDLLYVVHGAALVFGIPIDAVFEEIHASNMTKLINGRAALREDGKIMKGPDYRPPDIERVLRENSR